MIPKIAVVTGAARGIGLAVSQALLNDGWQVVGVDINKTQLHQTAAELTAAQLPFTPKVADLTDATQVEQLFAEVVEELGGVDALVNNAGTCFMNDFTDISAVEFRQQMAINFDSAFYCCQQAIPSMLTRPGVKKIVNISSNGAYNFDVFDPAHYRASKAAVDNLTKHLARRYAKEKICVNSIAPAMTRTDLFDVVSPEVLEQAIAGMPHGRPMEAAEIAAWVAFLISPAGDCSSGNVIILNQGRDVR
ncbi:MAG: SDR family oxidoreductase [Anaerolineales bacterium]|nr:SDR family oxidoreductase [Anaerolineales bacterium]